MELEDIVINQEDKIKDLSDQNISLSEEIKQKNNEIKNNESSCLSMIKLVEEYKKNLKSIQNKLKKKEDDDEITKKLIIEKDQEIHLLKNFVHSIKNDASSKILINF